MELSVGLLPSPRATYSDHEVNTLVSLIKAKPLAIIKAVHNLVFGNCSVLAHFQALTTLDTTG